MVIIDEHRMKYDSEVVTNQAILSFTHKKRSKN